MSSLKVIQLCIAVHENLVCSHGHQGKFGSLSWSAAYTACWCWLQSHSKCMALTQAQTKAIGKLIYSLRGISELFFQAIVTSCCKASIGQAAVYKQLPLLCQASLGVLRAMSCVRTDSHLA